MLPTFWRYSSLRCTLHRLIFFCCVLRIPITKMSEICHSCTNEIHEDRVTCGGFCTAVFHLKCCRLPSGLLDEINRNKQIFWMCNACAVIMSDVRHKKNVKAAYEAGLEKQLSSHTEILGNLKQQILDELKIEIRSSFSKMSNIAFTTPITSRRSSNVPRTIGSRRLFAKKDNNVPTLIHATGESESPSLGRLTVQQPTKKFWIYLSRISREVTPEQIAELTKRRLSTENIEVVRLVAKNKDIRTMSFISYKVGVEMELKSVALSSSTWPKGMLFREFIDDRKSENFWRPQTNFLHTTPNSVNSDDQSPMIE